jgi:hypothetical protein
MAGLVPAIHAVPQTAALEDLFAPSMKAFGWSSATRMARYGVDDRDKPVDNGERSGNVLPGDQA